MTEYVSEQWLAEVGMPNIKGMIAARKARKAASAKVQDEIKRVMRRTQAKTIPLMKQG